MAKKKVKPEQAEPDDPYARGRAIQWTPEQKAAARERLWKQVEEARRHGVYERIVKQRGKVHLDMDDLQEARKSKR